ncbi:MAG: hypothetical protein Q8N06_06605 [Hydrogenophaga sp.]|nr:hypothetical protein [Hydrogenophaga sp.]
MDRINTDTKAENLFGAGKHGFKNGDLSIGVYPTDLDEDWFNGAQEELMSIIEGAGVVPDIAVHTKVKQALKRLFGGNVTTVNTANSPFVLTADHAGLVIMDATAGNISATLPAAAAVVGAPLKFKFVRFDATANTATVNRAGADTFLGGATSFTIAGQGAHREIEGDAVSVWSSTTVDFASNAEAQALASTTKAISPSTLAQAFKSANQSLAVTGYQKLPGGLILQWGAMAAGAADAFFPVAFNTVLKTYLVPDQNTASAVIGQDLFDDHSGWPVRIIRVGTSVACIFLAIGY